MMKMTRLKVALLAAALPLGTLASPALAHDHAATAVYAPITVAEVEAAQQAWGQALVAISTEHKTKGHAAAKALAGQVLDSAYGYAMGPVLFKPTLTVAPQTFRTDRQGALAYFVGGDSAYPKDTGFALKDWTGFQIANAGIVITGNSAISMGNVTLTNGKGERTTVDKTWGYTRGPDGKLKIVLHHSSLPYQAK